MTVSEDFLLDATTRRAVFLQRYAAGLSASAQSKIDELREDILQILGSEDEQLRVNRSGRITGRIVSAMERRFGELSQDVTDEVLQLAEAEAEFTAEMLNRATTVEVVTPASSLLIAAVLRSGISPDEGPEQLTVSQALQGFSRAKSREIITALNDGVAAGDPLRGIAQTISALLNTRQKRHADTLTRTITNHAANQAKSKVFAENSAILDGYEWVAVLDLRTTLICAGRDGKVYPIGRGPLPPAHWNCRSQIVPAIDDDFEEPSVEGFSPGKRKPIEDMPFGEWLALQSDDFQTEFLGDTRAKLFRDGGLELDRFRDETGRVYTLEQLRELVPVAFDRAGIAQTGLQRL